MNERKWNFLQLTRWKISFQYDLTASRPKVFPWRLPYRTRRRPPAFVEMHPPIRQLSLAPRSSGIIKPTRLRLSSSFPSTQPASLTTNPGQKRKNKKIILEALQFYSKNGLCNFREFCIGVPLLRQYLFYSFDYLVYALLLWGNYEKRKI